MTPFASLFDRPAADFSGRLSAVSAPAPPPRPNALVLGLLLLICVVPRSWAAFRQDVLCSDTMTYLRICENLERGDLEAGFGYLGLNIYPLILILLRRSSLEWTVAGQWFNILAATLAVLPLYGWVRRQFNEQLALLACLLYALHPRMISDSPLIIRDPVFWVLFFLVLYFGWRAITEIRWWLFAAAGAALALVVHTRSEGWLLLVPPTFWCVFRLPFAWGQRVRLARGILLSLAMIPAFVVLMNVTLLLGHSRWELGRTTHFRDFRTWTDSFSEDEPALVGASEIDFRPPAAPWNTYAEKMVVRFVKAFTYVHGLLALAGLWSWRREIFRPHQLPLLLMVLILLACIWIHCRRGEFQPRYFFPIVLVSLPLLAQGLLTAAGWIARLTRRLPGWGRRSWPTAVLGLTLAVAAACLADVWIHPRPLPYEQADLGRWILRHLGPHQRIAGSIKEFRLVGYYAQGRIARCPGRRQFDSQPLLKLIEDWPPDVLLLWNDWRNPKGIAAYREILDRQHELGYYQVDQDRLPESCAEILVLVRNRR